MESIPHLHIHHYEEHSSEPFKFLGSTLVCGDRDQNQNSFQYVTKCGGFHHVAVSKQRKSKFNQKKPQRATKSFKSTLWASFKRILNGGKNFPLRDKLEWPTHEISSSSFFTLELENEIVENYMVKLTWRLVDASLCFIHPTPPQHPARCLFYGFSTQAYFYPTNHSLN